MSGRTKPQFFGIFPTAHINDCFEQTSIWAVSGSHRSTAQPLILMVPNNEYSGKCVSEWLLEISVESSDIIYLNITTKAKKFKYIFNCLIHTQSGGPFEALTSFIRKQSLISQNYVTFPIWSIVLVQHLCARARGGLQSKNETVCAASFPAAILSKNIPSFFLL